jgi:GxxExxY protein
MNTDEHGLKHKELTGAIIRVFYEVYDELGHGFLESVYQRCLAMALREVGLTVTWPIAIPVWFRGQQVGRFEGDMLVEKTVLLELKAVRSLEGSHQAQLLNYLRATDVEVGLLLNFGVKPEFKRLLFDNSRKLTR